MHIYECVRAFRNACVCVFCEELYKKVKRDKQQNQIHVSINVIYNLYVYIDYR